MKAQEMNELKFEIMFWAFLIMSNIYVASEMTLGFIFWIILAIIVFVIKLNQRRERSEGVKNK